MVILGHFTKLVTKAVEASTKKGWTTRCSCHVVGPGMLGIPIPIGTKSGALASRNRMKETVVFNLPSL